MSPATPPLPDLLLVVSSGCHHCRPFSATLLQLLHEGVIGHLEVVNATTAPELAATLDIRATPWLRLGELTFEGVLNRAELQLWLARYQQGSAAGHWLGDRLASGQLGRVSQTISNHPEWFAGLLALVDNETPLQVRLGIGAIFEGLATERQESEAEQLSRLAIEPLSGLGESKNSTLRADAAHWLGFCGTHGIGILKRLASDSDPDVADIALEGLQRIGGPGVVESTL